MEMSDQPHTLAPLSSAKMLFVPIELEAEWPAEPVWKFWKREKCNR